MIHKKTIFAAFAAVLCALGSLAQSSNVAYQDGNVRFTVITDGTIRMEYAPDGRFIDAPSFVAVNRSYPKSTFSVKQGNTIEVSTPRMTLRYKKGSGPFTADNLTITNAKGQKPFRWVPGLKDTLNLKGTYRTLDGYNGDRHWNGNTLMPIEDGLLSRSGWTLIDDSKNFLFDNSDWPWVEERRSAQGAQDLYFLAYGTDYKQALHDFTIFAGKAPLPPRYAFGYWWSRYWGYSDSELRELLGHFDTMGLPLDVLVIDMDWHYSDNKRGGWTGYTWNTQLFPQPYKFLNWLRDSRDLKVTLNLHPADGVRAFDTPYPAMAAHMGLDAGKGEQIPYEGSNKQFMSGLMDVVLRPMEKEGVSFWWLDWQQWANDKRLTQLSNTWWINYVFFSDMERHRNTRPMLYHRWGGLGNHRYQIGFSGDSQITWESLKFQPWFNSTASNVLYGYWSHDIGGHYGPKTIDPELYIRWMQFGALSPILRTHSSKSPGMNKEPWVFDYKHSDILRQIILGRYKMAPYIYTMAREAYDTGISLCRPLYYDYPEDEQSYIYKYEYMFGDQMLVAPIGEAMQDSISTLKVWLPAGSDWYEASTGTLLKGGQEVERRFLLDEYPLYIKAGSILPYHTNDAKNLRSNNEPLTVTVYPGADNGTFTLYEDAGDSKDYATRYATTLLSQHREGNTLTVRIGSRMGEYDGMPRDRKWRVKVLCTTLPEKIIMNEDEVPFYYDARELALMIDVPETAGTKTKTLAITFPDGFAPATAAAPALADGTIGQMKRARQALLNYKRKNCHLTRTNELAAMETAVEAIDYEPTRAAELVSQFRKALGQLPQLLHDNKIGDADSTVFLRSMGL